jgi:hypothetical protein
LQKYKTQFSPSHLEFDEKFDGRFLVHDRDDEKMELFATNNFGETFSHAGDFIKAFYFDYSQVGDALIHVFVYACDDVMTSITPTPQAATLLYVSRMEPNNLLNVLSSSSFFERQIDTKVRAVTDQDQANQICLGIKSQVVFTGALEFEMRGEFLFVVTAATEEEGQTLQVPPSSPSLSSIPLLPLSPPSLFPLPLLPPSPPSLSPLSPSSPFLPLTLPLSPPGGPAGAAVCAGQVPSPGHRPASA